MPRTGDAVIGDGRLLALYDYWRECRKGSELPARTDIDPIDIPQLLPVVILLDVVDDAHFRYRLVGTAVAAPETADPTGRLVEEVTDDAHLAAYQLDLLRAVVREARPLYCETVESGPEGDGRFIRRLLLPLASDHRHVDMVLGGQIGEILGPGTTPRPDDAAGPIHEALRRWLD